MTMDYSRLHTYTPPQCAPENTGYTYSLSSSYSTAALDFEKEHKIDPVFDSPRMSRRSLHLPATGGHHGDDSLQLDSSLNHSASYSVGGASRREARTVRSRKQQFASSTQTQTQTQTRSQTRTQSSSECSTVLVSQRSRGSCAAGHALQDESCAHGRAVVDGSWGLAGDGGLKEWRTERSMVLGNGDTSVTQTQTQTQTSMANGYICRDCTILAERKEVLTAYSSTSATAASSTASSSSSLSQSASSSTSIYSRDNIQKHKSGVLASVTDTCLRSGRRVVTSVVSLMSLLLLKTGFRAKGHQEAVISEGGHSSYCGSVNVKDLVTGDEHLNLNGSLCDDCKGRRHMETRAVYAQSSRARRLAAVVWSVFAYAGYGVLQTGRSVGVAGLYVVRKLLSVLWLVLISPGRAVAGVFWWLGTGWYQLVTLMSLLNVFILTRCLPKLFRLLLFLLPFLLILGLWFWGPSGLLCYLPAVNLTEWRLAPPFTLSLAPRPTPSTPLEQPVHKAEDQPATAPPPSVPQSSGAVFSLDLERLSRLEERLAELWEGVQRGGRLQEQQHGEALGLYASLREQLDRRTDRDSLGLWVSSLLEQRLTLLRSELQQDTAQTERTQDELRMQQQGYAARLSELEAMLLVLAAKTEEVQQKQGTPPPAPVSVGVDRESHDALLLEVQRLEAELGRIRQDLQGVMGCRGKCEQLDGLQDTVSAQVSAQVRRELRALFYGAEEGELPEPLLQWLSARFVRDADLQASLVSMETSILRNVSLQLEQSKQAPCAETITAAVEHAALDAGMSEEQVQLIVQNALRLYSQDRTGQVDYALESGGGSILSTRCSETYETKTALMSLFGVPLWYFSQSPRVVIQPDMYPGNCWAFKGSQGYLVIRLSMSVVPTAFCLEHISKALSPTGNISSAPRHFTVYGLDDEYQEEGKLLGQYTYREDGESLQTFPVMEENDRAYQIIEVRVLSNWGHPEYTCLYRFRVHGERKSK
ncbi:SUN domain-containing protein 1-like isoform X3 [Anguilla anguilla]|uniref:SUN domain-containing protein 1-like isoform X3 n=1 Tax=Anguilla anguilla TaxID=7936 RepID=UPI0015AC4B06|nr:SUN domain-containing protein 1-like isoform X3 [Anguilla anguilla]